MQETRYEDESISDPEVCGINIFTESIGSTAVDEQCDCFVAESISTKLLLQKILQQLKKGI